mgnify:CR=1 FL=1
MLTKRRNWQAAQCASNTHTVVLRYVFLPRLMRQVAIVGVTLEHDLEEVRHSVETKRFRMDTTVTLAMAFTLVLTANET